MLIQLLFSPLLGLVQLLITLLPTFPNSDVNLSALISFIRKGMYFTNGDIFATCIATIVAVETAMLGWNIIKFIYSKIPIINIHG